MLTISDVLAKRDIGECEARHWQSQTNYLSTLRSLRREDFQALAQRHFVDSRLIRVHILPGAKANEGDEKRNLRDSRRLNLGLGLLKLLKSTQDFSLLAAFPLFHLLCDNITIPSSSFRTRRLTRYRRAEA